MGVRLQAWLGATVVAVAVAVLDQTAKWIAASAVGRDERIDLVLGLKLVDVRNEGAAFGLFAGGHVPVLLLTVGVLALLVAYFALDAARPGLWIAVGLLTGGALSNLADRVRLGAVVDFLDPPLWPAFNLADTAIVLGLAWLVIVIGLERPKREPDDRRQAPDAAG